MLAAMSTLIVVPHRGLAAAKSRLAGRLSPDQRSMLAERLLRRVLTVVAEAACGEALVITPDPALQPLADEAGARLLVQHGLGLNAGLEQARRDAIGHGVELLAVLHGDLPWLSPPDVAALVEAVQDAGGVAVASDRAGSGTNGLAQRPADAIPFLFGPGSREAHEAAARAAGLPVSIVERPGLAFDLDTPADLERLMVEQEAG